MTPPSHPSPEKQQRARTRTVRTLLTNVLVPCCIVAIGVLATIYLLRTSPQAKPGKRPATPVLVETAILEAMPQEITVGAMGEIIPAREVDLRPRVSGEIVSTQPEFLPGGTFRAGEPMLQIDRQDYELVVKQLESEVQRARSDLALEMGNQRIAAREYALLGETVSAEEQALILRKPQLAKLKATLSSAEARLTRAQLDLERTTIRSPFNAVIGQRLVEIGAKVQESTVLAHLVDSDTYWLRLTLPVEQLQWLAIPQSGEEQGSPVAISPQGQTADGPPRTGRILRLAASLEERGRMAQLLVAIADPLALQPANQGQPALLLGSYVKAEITGVTLPAGIRIDRENLHENDTVWLVDSDGRLVIQPVEIAFRGREYVIATAGVQDGDIIVTSPLASPIAGTLLTTSPPDPDRQKDMGRATAGERS